jgi:flagellar hook-associated protein 3 FlgL
MNITRVPSNLLVSRIASDIVKQQNSLAEIQEQISSGKKVNRPSDAPAESAHLLTMNETMNRLEQYNKNSSIAESQLSLEEGALSTTTIALTRIRDLALRANSGQVNEGFREEINSEVKLKLAELFTTANSRDSFGNYLFSGSNIAQQPFKSGLPVTYSGSDDTARMEISLGRTIDTGDSGIDTFMRIRNGNGDFKTSSDDTNTGTGIISWGAVSDTSLYQSEQYQITFTSPTSFDVIDATSGAIVQTAQPFQANELIEFNGVTFRINGEPDAGDSFYVDPSSNQDVFSTVSNLITALEQNPFTDAEQSRMRADIDDAMGEIDNALNHLNTIRASVGSRLSSIDSSRDENSNVALQIERTKRGVEDVDIASAVTQLQTRANSLEIIQASFSRIEGLSLFNYMR